MVKKGLKIAFAVAVLFFIAGFLSACKTDEKKIAAKLWQIDHEDLILYRFVTKPDGSEKEQYYFIHNNPKMKEVSCMLGEDRKELWDAWVRCGCSL